MNSKSSFRVTFNIHHPNMKASEIETTIGLPTRYSQSVGEPRKTKTGELLGGIYKGTNLSFVLHEAPLSFDDYSIEELILRKLFCLTLITL